MRRLATAAALLLAAAAFADSPKKLLRTAEDALDDAREQARRSGRSCREGVASQLGDAADRVGDLRKDARPRELWELKLTLVELGQSASLVGCPVGVVEKVHQAQESLEEARYLLRGERNDRDQAHPDFVMPASMAPLAVQTNSVFDGEPAVRLTVPELRLERLQGKTFYIGTRYRSYEGRWAEWVTTQVWSVPADPFVWKNAFNHFLRYSALAEDDFSQGRFIAQVSVFDGEGHELASREATFSVRLPQLPAAPPVQVVPPQPVAPVVVRDCGTGNDPGCSMTRDGQLPMDGPTFQGAMASLRAVRNDVLRLDSLRAIMRAQRLTALQLGPVLDLFGNESLRLDAARICAPRLVNAGHALGWASKFRNSFFAREYTTLMSGQPMGEAAPQQPVVVPQPLPPQPMPPQPVPPRPMPPVPGQPMPPQPLPPQPMRDCGTGNDPGCMTARNGQLPMDAATFQGVVTALRSTMNELVREENCRTFLNRNMVTALQLGQILDLFNNEITRLDVAKAAAPRVVDPMRALGFSAKWDNSLLGQEYTQVMTAQ